MKAIIAGSRSFTEAIALDLIRKFAQEHDWNKTTITEVVSGGARGPDRAGEAWAREAGIPIRVFRPQWDTYGKRAGFVRNYEMGNYGDVLVAVWDRSSRGTLHMIEFMKRLKKPQFILEGLKDSEGLERLYVHRS